MEERIFNYDTGGVASEYVARIDLAYLVGLFVDHIADDLRLIGKIRNRFAHRFEPIDFNDEKIANWCNTLHFKMAGRNPRDRYLIAFTRITTVLLVLKNITDMKIPNIAKQSELAKELDGVSLTAD